MVAVSPAAPAGRFTLYEVMDLRADATGSEIKAAYQRWSGTRTCDFIRLHDAYAMFSDLDARARNDRDVVAQAYAQPPASKPPPHGFWGSLAAPGRRTNAGRSTASWHLCEYRLPHSLLVT
jgi:hypothetical protein